jgi:ATP/maltotriose-dependent transcriptional regulator MalT
MSTPILATKLYVPPHQPKVVLRPRLIERLNEGLDHRLTLISAQAGFGKSALLSEWLAGSDRPAAWLSLEEGDNDPTRFLAYLVAALQTIAADIGEGVLSMLRLEVLQLIAQGLSNREISERLFLAIITVKGHNRNISRKLQVRRRTEAVARARELALL